MGLMDQVTRGWRDWYDNASEDDLFLFAVTGDWPWPGRDDRRPGEPVGYVGQHRHPDPIENE
jgi:hypothetical protein